MELGRLDQGRRGSLIPLRQHLTAAVAPGRILAWRVSSNTVASLALVRPACNHWEAAPLPARSGSPADRAG